MTDQRIDRWNAWIDGKIKDNVLTMHLQRDAYMKVSRILESNRDLPDSYWWELMVETYITTQAMAVRRQADRDRRVASLARLIMQVRDKPSAITREYWIGQWRDDPDDGPWIAREAERGWAEQYAGDVGDHLDPAIPTADYDRLQTESAKVTRFVNEHVAHSHDALRRSDAKHAAQVENVSADAALSAKEVHEVVDVIGELFKKYFNLLTASSYAFLVPVLQHDWLAAFRVPWMKPGTEPDD